MKDTRDQALRRKYLEEEYRARINGVAGGKYALCHFELDGSQYSEAWNPVHGGWLPNSGYQPDDRPCFELYHGRPEDHPEGKGAVEICVPVKPL